MKQVVLRLENGYYFPSDKEDGADIMVEFHSVNGRNWVSIEQADTLGYPGIEIDVEDWYRITDILRIVA